MVGLVGAFFADVEVFGLVVAEDGELDADFLEVEAGDFFVEFFAEAVDAGLVGVLFVPEVELGEGLVGEAGAHDEGGVAGGAAEVHEAAFGKHVDAAVAGDVVAIILGLDVDAGDALFVVQLVDLDFVVEVTDVGDDGLSFMLSMCFKVMTSLLPVVVT